MLSSLKYELCQCFQIQMIKVVPKMIAHFSEGLRCNRSPPVPVSESIHTYLQNDILSKTRKDSIILIYFSEVYDR